MSNMMAIVASYAQAREEKKKANEDWEKWDQEEKRLAELILLEMSSQGIKTANIEGLGRVTRKENYHYEIQDVEALARKMLENMVRAHNEGRPLSDGFLLQRRVHKDNVETLLADQGVLDQDRDLTGKDPAEKELEKFGLKKASKNVLSFTKA